jgi:hypothetical protein
MFDHSCSRQCFGKKIQEWMVEALQRQVQLHPPTTEICGIKSFYIPRSNPDGVSVNIRCLDPETIAAVRVTDFDGRNWEAHADRLRNLSREGV